MGLPACAWDAGHGLVVLYRQTPSRGDGLRLVVAPTGAPAWYAGEMPAGESWWAVKAPRNGAFRLLLFPERAPAGLSGEPPALVDGTPAVLAFDARLRVEPGRAPGGRAHYEGWVVRGASAASGQPCALTPFAVAAGETLAEVLHALGCDTRDGLGVIAARALTVGALVVRGPAMHPLRPAGGALGVHFTLVPDPPPEAPDAVQMPAFAALAAPAIAVDIGAFGEAAETLRSGLWFFHHPHGPERGVAHWSGADVPLLEDEQGGRYLLFTADDACHLDLLGVAVVGGPWLFARPDPSLTVHGAEAHAAGTDCLLALYSGDAWLLPASAAAPYAALARDYCPALDVAALSLARDAPWLSAARAPADWRGAETAEAFTLAAFARWLDALDADSGALASLLTRHGLEPRAFATFAERADLLLTLLVEPALSALLAGSPGRAGALLAHSTRSPVAALAGALEADAGGLADWVDAVGPDQQAALWQWLLVGGRAADWRALQLTPALTPGPPEDLAALVGQVARAQAPDPGGALATTAEDLGASVPAQPLSGLAHALARAEGLARAHDLLAGEVGAVNGDIGEVPGLSPLDLERLLGEFGAALAAGGVAGRRLLHGRLLAALGQHGPAALDLAATVTSLRTQAVLWGLSQRLGLDTAADGAGRVADIAFDPAPATAPLAKAAAAGASLAAPLAWCLRVLQHAEANWPLEDGDGAVDLDAGIAECQSLLVDLDAWWGLADPQPVALPRWTGATASAAQARSAAIAADGWQVRARLQAADDSPQRTALIAILDRIVAAREYLVADALWADAKARLAARPGGASDPQLLDLHTRMGRAGPGQWAALAAALADG